MLPDGPTLGLRSDVRWRLVVCCCVCGVGGVVPTAFPLRGVSGVGEFVVAVGVFRSARSTTTLDSTQQKRCVSNHGRQASLLNSYRNLSGSLVLSLRRARIFWQTAFFTTSLLAYTCGRLLTTSMGAQESENKPLVKSIAICLTVSKSKWPSFR